MQTRKFTLNRPQPTSRRRGAAAVELAVFLPVLAILIFGSLSATAMIFLRQAVVQSAYETIKDAVKPEGTVAQAMQKGEQVLSFRGITADSVTFTPGDVKNQDRGTVITVTIVATADPSRFSSFGPFHGQTVEVNSTMLKE